MTEPLKFPAVPILGQPCTMNGLAVVAAFTCNCSPEAVAQMIPNLRMGVGCPLCRKVYAIVDVNYGPSRGKDEYTINVIGRMPDEEKPH